MSSDVRLRPVRSPVFGKKSSPPGTILQNCVYFWRSKKLPRRGGSIASNAIVVVDKCYLMPVEPSADKSKVEVVIGYSNGKIF